jgi:NAD dependent epimerase/dehydratase family enzyme
MSWIHERDFLRAVDFMIASEDMSGTVNLAAPYPIPQREFLADLRHVVGMPIGIPSMKWMLEIMAFVHRTDTELLLKSRRVIPGRLLEKGFAFDFPEWAAAAEDLYRRWRRRSGRGILALATGH